MKEIPLTQGYTTLVDDEDYEELSKHKWTAAVRKHTVYAIRYIRIGGKTVCFLMHRVLVNAVPDMKVDHKNHNGLDNQRHNIRECTESQNQQNRTHAGVFWDKVLHRWRARIGIDGKMRYLGVYVSKDAAVDAYRNAASWFFEEFACDQN